MRHGTGLVLVIVLLQHRVPVNLCRVLVRLRCIKPGTLSTARLSWVKVHGSSVGHVARGPAILLERVEDMNRLTGGVRERSNDKTVGTNSRGSTHRIGHVSTLAHAPQMIVRRPLLI